MGEFIGAGRTSDDSRRRAESNEVAFLKTRRSKIMRMKEGGTDGDP
jgi:hypothetical protein